VRYTSTGAVTQSLAVRGASGTVRMIEATHNFEKLMKITSLPYQQVNGGR
jgi:fructose-1,6-bisphosphatase II